MTTQLATELSRKLAETNQPFSVDFSTLNLDGATEVTLPGFSKPFASFNELLAIEDWYLSLQSDDQAISFKLRSLSTKLGKVYRELALKSGRELTLTKAVTESLSPPKAVAESDEYLEFTDTYSRELAEIFSLIELLDNKLQRIKRVTLFIATRYDKDWDYSNTVSLRKSQIEAVDNFISLESNGGVLPTASEESEEEPAEGKAAQQSATTIKSTGELTV